MNTLPRVSIIIPVYNGNKYLHKTVHSVISQTYSDFEILIVNDGSTDNTEEIALNLQKHDVRIKYYKKQNSGVSDSRNFGLSKSAGEFVVFFDADDIMAAQFIQSRIDFLLTNPSIGICGSLIKIIDDNGNEQNGTCMQAPGKNMLEDILYYKPGIATVPSNFMYRKDVLKKIKNCFDPELSSTADRLLLCKLALITKCYCLPTVDLYYRVHAQSMYNEPKARKKNFKDNELFVSKLLTQKIVPENLMREFLDKNYYMLAVAALKAGYYKLSLTYTVKYLLIKVR